MKQRVTAHAHHLCPVPIEEGSGGLAYLGWMGDAVRTDWAPLPLVLKHPAQAKKAHREGRDKLNIDGWIAAEYGASIGEIE